MGVDSLRYVYQVIFDGKSNCGSSWQMLVRRRYFLIVLCLVIVLNIEIVDPVSPVETFMYRCIFLAAFVFWCIVQRIAFLT